ncbi:hypothetical protein [Roseibium sp.]|uniref:hypothetical protein n=1 Tax=Roseibium sp. TaxID=1936156 RepID=UPI003D125F32
METKPDDQHKQVVEHPSSEDASVSSAEAGVSKACSKSAKRSVREMVIENNQRFAATMKSLGE